MRLNYKPKSSLEKFGSKIYFLLVDNFPRTFYVGGMVRDFLLYRPVTDVDLATAAKPDEVVNILNKAYIRHNDSAKNFGVIKARRGSLEIEIATFRKDSYASSRYPQITFVKTARQDSQRRDFTVNALYFSPKSGKILDFHQGLDDLNSRRLKFIGNAEKRIKEDPLRIIRAIRFSLQLRFKIEIKTELALEKNLPLLKQLTAGRVEAELDKIIDPAKKQIARTLVM